MKGGWKLKKYHLKIWILFLFQLNLKERYYFVLDFLMLPSTIEVIPIEDKYDEYN